MPFNADDPRYTAYVLGELDDNQRSAIDAELDADPTAAAAVADIRATTLRLSAALQSEPLLLSGATGSASAPLSETMLPAATVDVVTPASTSEPKLRRRRLLSWKTAIGALAAISGCGLIAALLLPAVNNARQSASRSVLTNSFEQIDPSQFKIVPGDYASSSDQHRQWHDQPHVDLPKTSVALDDFYSVELGLQDSVLYSTPLNMNGGTLAKNAAGTTALRGRNTNVVVGAENTPGFQFNSHALSNSASDRALRVNAYAGATTVTGGTLAIGDSEQEPAQVTGFVTLGTGSNPEQVQKMLMNVFGDQARSANGSSVGPPPSYGPVPPSKTSGLDPAGQPASGKIALGYARDEHGGGSSDYLIERVVSQDPHVIELSKSISYYEGALGKAVATAKNPAHDPSIRSLQGQLSALQSQRDRVVAELRPQVAAQIQQMQPTVGAGGESEFNTEFYAPLVDNRFLTAAENPLSTFSIDVDTASYSNIRRFLLQQNQLPPPGAVRIEEMINYFRYEYPQPAGDKPFSVTTEVASCPWAAEHRLVRIGLKGRELEHRPPSNLVFLIDVSGSMEMPAKLPLVQASLKMLTQQLGENDHVAIVVYAGNSGLVLPSTRGDKHEEIIDKIEQLRAGGSTNGGQGIELAYEIACQNILKGGVNRVILATDGDFNVGITNQDALVRLIQDKAKTGVFLTTLGFGYGNLKDSTMQMLADKGNGNNYYIDDLAEARKVLVEQIGGTLVTIAKDVKLQIEFNPAEVAAYRLIGYEKRILAKEDFNDDTKDAGEIGAGHTVTALYEIVPLSGAANGPQPDKSDVESRKSESATAEVDPLKYQKPSSLSDAAKTGELFTLKLRYKQPDGDKSTLMETPVKDAGTKYGQASADFKFAAAVASFGMILRDSAYKGNATLAAVKELAQEGVGKVGEKSDSAYRAEFVQLVEKAKSLAGPQ